MDKYAKSVARLLFVRPKRTESALCVGILLGMSLGQGVLAAPPSVSIGDASVIEGNTGTSTLIIPVTRSGSTSDGIVIGYQTNDSPDNPATAGTDYSPVISRSAFLPPGAAGGNIPLTVVGDTEVEDDEQFLVHLTSATTVGPAPTFGSETNISQPARARHPQRSPTLMATAFLTWSLPILPGGMSRSALTSQHQAQTSQATPRLSVSRSGPYHYPLQSVTSMRTSVPMSQWPTSMETPLAFC